MALNLPKASVTVRKAGLGVATSGPTNVHVAIGPASKGPFVPMSFNTPDGAAAVFGCGPMPKSAAYATRARNATYIVVRVPAVATAAFTSTITKPTGKTVTVAPTSGVAQWGYDVSIVITTGGTVGVAGIFYKTSINGGVDYTAPVALGTATKIVVGGKDVTLTAAETFALNDVIAFYTLPASQAIQDPTITRVGSSTCVVTVTGTPEDEYSIAFEVVKGGEIGTTGIVFRYSMDGENWSPNTQLGTATTFDMLDGTEPSGISFAFAAGTLDTGDKVTSKTTGPVWQASDVVAALGKLYASTFEWRFIHVVGDCTAAKAGTVGGEMSAMGGKDVFTYSILSARDRSDGEVDSLGAPSSFWADRLISDYAAFASDRVAISAGRAKVACPITGRTNRRPTSWITVARLVENTIQIDPGRVLDGPLSADVRIYDDNGNLSELDARVASALHEARFLTLRTYERRSGTYITRGNAMAADGSEFNRIAMRAVMDVASEVFHSVMLQQIENDLACNPLTGVQPGQVTGESLVPGALAEPDARILDRELLSALTNVLVASGYVSAVRARVSRTDPFLTTGQLTAKVSITPLGYVDSFAGEIGFENPKFAALVA